MQTRRSRLPTLVALRVAAALLTLLLLLWALFDPDVRRELTK